MSTDPLEIVASTAVAALATDESGRIVIWNGAAERLLGGLSTAMPPWGHTLNERQIGYLIQYLRTLTSPPSEDATGS